LQVYDLRREDRLRQARDWFFKNYHVSTFEEAMKLAPMGSQESAYAGMVWGYWEQTCALLNHGLLHEDLFFETTGEFFGVWERLKPIVPQLRTMLVDPNIFQHMEEAARRYEEWSEKRAPGHVKAMREFMQKMRPQAAAAAR
jgi:hypothetical protein